ncbi:MAG: type II secretion system secretin GspD [Desulfobacula sp.]|nr:type II secretion system secretin GspD [Desulfobacula sp.]
MIFIKKLAGLVLILSIFCSVFLIDNDICLADDSTLQNRVDKSSEFVSIDFNNVDINVFIKFMSKLTGKNFVVDRSVKGNVTIISPTKISVKEAYKVFESVLDINGYATVESGKIIKIIPAPRAKGDNIDTKLMTNMEKSFNLKDKIVTRLIPLEYARSDELKRLFTPLVPKGSIVLSYPDTNMLIVTATLTSINRLLKIVKTIDTHSIGKVISVIPIKNADASKLVGNLSKIFTARSRTIKGKKNIESNVNFVADERTNSIILLASKVQTDKVKNLIEILDQEVPKGEERIRVYYLEHASAENLVKVLLEIPSGNSNKALPGKKTAPILSTKVKIMADKATNSLVIMADKEDYPVLEEVIHKLDIPRAMVYIECLIMEVDVNSGLNIGTEWQAGASFNDKSRVTIGGFGNTDNSGYPNVGSIAAGSLPKGFSVGVLGKSFTVGGLTFPDIQAVVQAYQSDKDVKIIATPQILTTENEEASIIIGKNVPFQTRSAADSGTETYSSYEYKDVGITLKITPQISKDRLVRLNVFMEKTNLDSVNQSSTDRPTTFKRKIETTIIVEDSNSVVIGGLIDETFTKTEYKTPCLGDIPLLGWGFKTVSKGNDKTNLYVFLTPRVIKNPLELEKIYKEKKNALQTIKKGEVLLFDKKRIDTP